MPVAAEISKARFNKSWDLVTDPVAVARRCRAGRNWSSATPVAKEVLSICSSTAEIAEVGVSSDLKAEPTLKEKKAINTEIYNALKEKDEEKRALLLSTIKEKYTEFDSYVERKISELASK